METLTHQKWSGAELLDAELQTVVGGLASTAAMGADNTEMQFRAGTSGKNMMVVKRGGFENGETVVMVSADMFPVSEVLKEKPTEQQFSRVLE